MSEQTTYRTRHGKNRPYFALRQETAQDKTISFEARGMLAYLLSKPDNWKVNLTDLQKNGGIGRDQAKRILNELKAAKYIVAEKQLKKPDGTFARVEYRIYEAPFTENPSTDNQSTLDSTEEHSTESTNDSPSPQNGDGQTPSKTKTEKPEPTVELKTTVVHFKDVKDHWDSLKQEWDDNRYVYIGRANNHYGLPQSKWRNPFIMRDGDDERARVIHEYEVFIKAPRQIKLYNAIPELRGKILVCWCAPLSCHGDILAKLANDPKFKPKDAWYEAVFETFKYTGGRNVDMQKMLRGEATKKGYAEYNLDPPLRTPDELLKWRDWWLADHDDLSILEARDKVQSSIGTWRNDLLNKAVAPKADQPVYYKAKEPEEPTEITPEIEKMIAETKAKLKGETG